MSKLTCLTCRIAFEAGEDDDIMKVAELHRVHFATDWHTYNLKRKVASLPPVTAEVFNERVAAHQKQNSEAGKSLAFHCSTCHKKFASEETYNDHMESKKHLFNERNEDLKPVEKEQTKGDDDEDSEVEELSDDEWESEPLSLDECLFCDKVSKDMTKNIEHMTTSHGFFIPYSECVINLPGLMSYLAEKVGCFQTCLWCYCEKFYEVRAIKSHMLDKGHCKIRFDDKNPEYSPFYDYSKLPQEFQHQENELSIILPSGAVLGHRELFNYYKQRVSTRRDLLNKQHALGGRTQKQITQHGERGEEAKKRARAEKMELRMRSRALLKIGVKANKLQRHFRDQVFGF